MKASDVLQQYAEGRRDFRGEDLRGQNFRGKDLSGCDFSGCNIRGTNFEEVNLTEINFSQSKAGLKGYWIIIIILFSLILSSFAGFISAIISTFIIYLFTEIKTNRFLIFIGSSIFMYGVRKGLYLIGENYGYGELAIKIHVAIALIIILAVVFFGVTAAVVDEPEAQTGGIYLITFVVIIYLMLLITNINKVPIDNIPIIGKIGTFLNISDTPIVGTLGGFLGAFLGCWFGRQAINFDPKFHWIWKMYRKFAILGGTTFYKADLTDANFTEAVLENSDLRAKSLLRTRFQGVKHLDLARVGKTLLSQTKVRELLVNPNMGYKKNYFKANLRGANLDDANLKEANLSQADLRSATFKNADLRDSNLTEVNAINADFTHVYLTGACLEGWNIDQSTILDNIDCQYVYFLNNKGERRPSSGDFLPGEFSQLFKQTLDSVIFLFKNGVNWKAFSSAFKDVQFKHQETPLDIETIENKGGGIVIIKVKVSPNADKATIHQDFIQDYQFKLKQIEASYQKSLEGKEKEIDISNQQINSLDNIIEILANLPDQSQPIKTIKLLPDGQGIETIEEETNLTQNKVSSQIIRELQKEYKKTKKLIEEKYEAILESKQEIIESKQMEIEAKQEQINDVNEQLKFFESLTKKLNQERLNMNFNPNNDTVNE